MFSRAVMTKTSELRVVGRAALVAAVAAVDCESVRGRVS